MERLTIFIKQREHVDFLYQFLQHLDFVVMPTVKTIIAVKQKTHSIFDSAGIWENRNITPEDLRAKAWKRV